MPGITAMRICSASASTGSPEHGGVGGEHRAGRRCRRGGMSVSEAWRWAAYDYSIHHAQEDSPAMQPHNYQAVMNRFVAACQADERVVAATLYGSYARDEADAYSNLDFG